MTPKERVRNGVKTMGLLPKNERRTVDHIAKKVMWIYGPPFSGKTFLTNTFPDVVMLNTDGNIKFVDAPYVEIKDRKEGRVDKPAWEIFKGVIDELAMKNNDFKTIVVDLLEDTYNHCRQYVLAREGLVHESDAGFGKGWSLVDDEFLNTISKLISLDYENIILLSHEVKVDVNKKTGDKVTSVVPNIREKIAFKVAGKVDFTGRFIAEGDERTINIKQSEFLFGGGRMQFRGKVIPATYEAIVEMYNINPMEMPTTAVSVPADAQTPEQPVRRLKRKDEEE